MLAKNLKKSFLTIGCWSILLLFVTTGYAIEQKDNTKSTEQPLKNPVTVLKNITDSVLDNLKNRQDEIQGDIDKLYTVVYDSVVPHVDFVEISKWVAGKKAWREASESQQSEFLKQFKLIIIRTYATALNKYSDQKVDFKPLKKGQEIRKRMQISSAIWDSKNKKNISVVFRVVAAGDTWKVYDLIIEGVSLLKGFQVQFSNLIRNQGIGAAIAKMKDHNSVTLSENLIRQLT